jgi:hypothetical protein
MTPSTCRYAGVRRRWGMRRQFLCRRILLTSAPYWEKLGESDELPIIRATIMTRVLEKALPAPMTKRIRSCCPVTETDGV